ncbi:addiction module protein [Mariniblastus sp.]|nr:addiction module protein [Mariniblastus sp.]
MVVPYCSPQQIIASALLLPAEQRALNILALQETILDNVDHGPSDSPSAVEAAWACEIKRRIDDVRTGHVQTIPSAEAWKLINGDSQGSEKGKFKMI